MFHSLQTYTKQQPTSSTSQRLAVHLPNLSLAMGCWYKNFQHGKDCGGQMCQQVTFWADLTTEAKRHFQYFVTLTWPTSTPLFYTLHSECKVSYQGIWCPSFFKLRSCRDSSHRGFSSASRSSDTGRFFSFRIIHFNVIPEQQENTSHCPPKSLSEYCSLHFSPKKSYIELPILHSRMIQYYSHI